MNIENVLDGLAIRTVGRCEVSFDRHDPGSLGYFSVDKLREALDNFEEHTNNDGVYLRLGTAAYTGDDVDKEYDTLLALFEDEFTDAATVCCPRYDEEQIEIPKVETTNSESAEM